VTGAEKAHRLQQALESGGPTHRLDDVVALIKDGRAKLWERGDGVVVTEINHFPLCRAVNYWLAAGTLRDCLSLQAEIDPWAIENGCTVATLSGRRGWGRAAGADGWRVHMTSFCKPLV
jgi:hypothetical protein